MHAQEHARRRGAAAIRTVHLLLGLLALTDAPYATAARTAALDPDAPTTAPEGLDGPD